LVTAVLGSGVVGFGVMLWMTDSSPFSDPFKLAHAYFDLSVLRLHVPCLVFKPAYAVATVLAALDVIRTEPERRQQLLANADYLRNGLKALGYDTATSETPIIPIVIGDATKTFRFWRALFDGGVFANCVVAPAVPPNSCRIRTSLIATHTRPQLDRVLDTFAKVGKEFGVI